MVYKYPIICRVSYIPGGAGFLPSTVAFKHMELDPWLTSPDSPEKRATGREGGRHCKRSALKVAEESNGCTSLPRFKSKCQFKNSRLAVKHRKPGSGNSILMGNFANPTETPIYLLYPFGFSFGHSKKHNSPSWWNNHLPVLPGVWVATRNAGILVIKVPPRLVAISKVNIWLWWVW